MRQSHHRQQRWIPAYNSGSQTIPPLAVVEYEAVANPVTGEIVLHVKRPTEDNLQQVAVNSHNPIPGGMYGKCTLDYPTFVSYDSGDTPALGEYWGTQTDSFLIKEGNIGYEIVGGAVAVLGVDAVMAVRSHRNRFKAKVTTTGGITAGGSGTVELYMNGTTSGLTQTAYLNWMHGGSDVSQNKETVIEWFDDEMKWVIVAAECE